MPIAKSHGLNISYEVEGDGQAIVLAHGLSMSIADWKDHGYGESLSREFNVILVDSRGHGHSDKPRDPAL